MNGVKTNGKAIDSTAVENDISAPKGLFDTNYARRKKALMGMMNGIRSTGAAVDHDLPSIVVAGNQSSGKSSLIEAISAIKLPRAEGTCTRVPIEVRLRQEDVEWKCVMKIRRESSDLQSASNGSQPEVAFGDPITDPDKVEYAVRLAQFAVLNPSVQSNKFLTYEIPNVPDAQPLGSSQQFRFSNDVIVIEITGPHQTDLTLVDLPGIIQNGPEEDIALIRNMVKSYISKDCLILLVLPAIEDIQGASAAMLALQADPSGSRTIGVVTKIDDVQTQVGVQRWLKVVQNTDPEAILKHGYYVTRQPDSDELLEGISFERARELEHSFFSGTAPWNTLDRPQQRRLGTKNLAAALSHQLSLFIQAKLPVLERQASDMYRQLAKSLADLGDKPSDDPLGALQGLLINFEISVNRHIEGQANCEDFIQTSNELGGKFVETIRKTSPTFLPIDQAKASSCFASNQVVPAFSGEITSLMTCAAAGGGRATADQLASVGDIRTKNGLKESMRDPKFAMNLDDMRLHVQGCCTRELPNQLPPAALAKLIKRCTSTWEELSLDLLEDIKPVVKNLLDEMVQDTFGSYTYGGLTSSIGQIVSENVELLLSATQEQIRKQVAMERRPYTRDIHYLESCHAKYLARLKGQRKPSSEPPVLAGAAPDRAAQVTTVLSGLAALGLTGLKEEDLPKLQATDEYETELNLMAQVSAYWKVAYKRTIDNIPRAIDLVFITPLPTAMRNALQAGLKVSGGDAKERCKGYLEEAPDIAEQRNDLEVRLQRLGEVKDTLRNFKMS